MTFKEELTKISDITSFKISVDNECATIKEMMKEAASIGIRTFQIEIVRLFPGRDYGVPAKADNYYVILARGNHCNDDYKAVVFEFLQKLGFKRNEVEVATITNACGCHTDITVRW